jgi:hypothetical protein
MSKAPLDPEVLLRCPGCARHKPTTGFVPRRTPTGFSTLCRECIEHGKHWDNGKRKRVCDRPECFEPIYGVRLCRKHYSEQIREWVATIP